MGAEGTQDRFWCAISSVVSLANLTDVREVFTLLDI